MLIKKFGIHITATYVYTKNKTARKIFILQFGNVYNKNRKKKSVNSTQIPNSNVFKNRKAIKLISFKKN